MTTFCQLHLLTSYPPANLNRDDTGRPKTARIGGAERLRVSSQSLKRAFRTSAVFADKLNGHIGTRTKLMGNELYKLLIERGMEEDAAKKRIGELAGQFGAVKKGGNAAPGETEQLAHISPEERAALDDLASRVLAGEDVGKGIVLKTDNKAADIAMFGRMLADTPVYNVDAAVQVAHAITTHRVTVEDDYFTAVDDLKLREETRGAGHVGENEFAAGLFYLYICINCDLLRRNLQGDTGLARETLEALATAAATVAPTGKQNSYASRAYASYILAERGPQQPRSLSVAYLKPVGADDYLKASIEAIEETRGQIERAYGPCSDANAVMNVPDGKGTLAEIIAFMREC